MLVCVKVGSCYIKGHVEDGFQMKDDKLCKSLPKGTFLRCRDFPIHSRVASTVRNPSLCHNSFRKFHLQYAAVRG